MNTVYSRHTAQKINNIPDELINNYSSAEWLINPSEQEVLALNSFVSNIQVRRNLREVGKKYVDLVLAEFMTGLESTNDPGTKQAISDLDELMNPVKIHLSNGEFISALNCLKSIDLQGIFTEQLKSKLLDEIQQLIDSYYPNLY